MVRSQGWVFSAAISRFASRFDGLARGYLFEPEFRQIVERDLRDGQHRNPSDDPRWFTTAYFHCPGELREEADEVRLDVVEIFGIEGLAASMPQLTERWDVPEARETITYAARVVELKPSLLALSAHLLLVARRG